LIVLDCSYAMAMVMPDERRPVSIQRVADAPLVAPAIWPLEVANALRSAAKRGRVREDQVGGLCADLDGFGIEIATQGSMRVADAYAAAARHDLSAYDAAYLELALQRRHALATLDARLAALAAALGLSVLH
jgi:predicted nucleic acid-binding protein